MKRFKLFAAIISLVIISSSAEARIVTGQCGEHLDWSFDTETGALVITGYGDMNRGNVSNANTAFGCFDYGTPVDYVRKNGRNQIVTIRSGVVCTTGDWYRFGPVEYCLAPWSQYITQITSVTLPEGIKSIAGTAFRGATNLTSIQFPSTLEYIGGDAFSYSGLTSIDVPGTVKYIEKYAFYNCRSLTSLTLNEGTVRLRANCFENCVSLSNIVCNAVELVPQISNYYGGSFRGLVDNHGNWINDMTIVIPAEAVDAYEGSDWAAFLESAHVVIAGSFTVTVTVNNTSWGTATGSGTRTYGQTAEIYASAYEGYEFLRWDDNSSTTNPRSIVVTKDTTIKAYFGVKEKLKFNVELTANPAEGGTFAGGGTYTEGDVASTVEALPSNGYEFVKWDDGETNALHSSFTVNSDKSLTATFRKKKYTITLAADGGSISGATSGNSYEYQTVLNLTANPDDCHSSVVWDDGSTSLTRNYTVEGNANLTATFDIKSYNLTVQSGNEAMGTVNNVSGSHDCGSSVTMIATPKTGHQFKQWTKGGVNVGTNPSLTITVSEIATYTAIFEPIQYTITTETGGNGSGSVSGGGQYNYNATPTLTANANAHSTFTKWQKNGTDVPGGTNTSLNITVTENATYTAVFTLNKYTITTATNGEGSVTGAGTYDYNTSVSLKATASTGSTFSKWTDGNTENPRPITVTGDASYTAVFTLNQYTITATKDGNGNGSVTGGNTYNYNATATLTATVGAGSTFDGWYKNGVKVSSDAQYSFTVTESAEYKAKFILNKYTITVAANNDAYGTVSGGGTFDYGTTHTIRATANTGSPFAKWLKDGNEISTSESTEITVDGDALYIAVFVLNEYTITVNTSGNGAGTVTGGGTYNHGETATLTATANTGSTFTKWQKNGADFNGNTNPSINVTVDAAATYTAIFTLNQYTITTATNGGNGLGTISGGGTYDYGTSVTLKATANTGSTFTKWSDGVETASRQIEVTGNASYTAIFTLNKYTITTNTSGNGTVTAGGTYDYGTPITLTATAGTGSSFSKWQKDGVDYAGGASINVTVEAEATYTAVFTLNQYTITVLPDNASNGSVTGGGTFDYGTQIQISATPNASYNFGGWNDGNIDNPRTITVSETKTYTATFTQKVYYGVSVGYDSKMGDVTGTGSFEVGTPINLVAAPKTGYTFEKWSDGKTSATYPEFNLTDNVSLGATFKPIAYTITGVANPSAYGTVTVAGGNSHDYNTDVTLTASANYGYKFVDWADDGSVTPERTVKVTGEATYTANFEKDQFHIYVNSNNNTMGNVSGAGNYDYLDEATLTATPVTGYVFSKWQKDGVDYAGGASINVTVDAEVHYTAFFSPDRYAITIEKEGEGTTSGDGTYEYNTNATLTANAAVGYTFIRWEKDGVQISTESSYTVKVTAAATYKAVFSKNSYNIAVATSGNGSGTYTGNGLYYHGDDVTLEATANTGSSFSGWYKGNEKVSDDNRYSFKATETTTYTAEFTLNKYTLTTKTNGNGTVTAGGEYDYGTEVDIKATENEGSEFVEWAEDHLTTPSRKVTIHSNCTYTAVFKLKQFYISATSADMTMGSVSGSGTYNYGETATIKAKAEYGYEFDKWNDESTVEEKSFTVTKAENFVASFKKRLFTVNVEPNNSVYGTVTGVTSGSKYEFGSTLTITATANDHYHFVGWSDHATEATRQITVNDDINLTAEFAPDRYIISLHSENDVMGSTTGSGTYNYLDNVAISAKPNYGYDFVKWSDESTDASRNFTATESVDLTASFAIHKFNVTLKSSNNEFGNVTGAGQYDYNSEAEISAIPEYGYNFVEWSDGSTEATRTITVTKDSTFEASFAISSFYIGVAMNDTTMGDITGAGYYNYKETATLIATPRYGYEFISWSNEQTDSLITIIVTKKDIYSALFKPRQFNVTLNANDDEMGIVVGGDTYYYLDTVEICATPNDGYKFLRWSDDITDSLRTIVVNTDIEITAVFAKEDAKIYTVSLTVNDENMGTVSGASDYVDGDIAIISATANPGYEFTNWSDGDTTRTREIVVVCDTALMANFKALPIPANYVVRHNQQALDGSFAIATTDTLTGFADSLTAAVALTFEGFTAQPFEQGTISSVSTTIVEIMYNRNKYELKWDFGTEKPIDNNYTQAGLVAYGTPIVAPKFATDESHGFEWDTLPETMPAANITCKANWWYSIPEIEVEHFDFTVPATFNGCESETIEVTDCQETNVKFEWSINGVVDESQTGLTFSFPANAPATGRITVTGTATSGGNSSSWTYEIPYTLRKNITTRMWNDVITVDNTTGNYESYKWYHNGEFVSESAYYQEIGGLTGEYYLTVTTIDGTEISSCPETFEVQQAATITAYPNPTTDKIIVESGKMKAGDRLIITDSNGKIWETTTITNPAGEEFDLSNLPQGTYTVTAGSESINIIKL